MNMVAACTTVCEMTKKEVSRHAPNFEYRTIAHLPIAHIAGVQGYFVNPVYMGGPTFWMKKFDFEKFLEYNRRHRISFFFSVPPIYLLIAKNPAVTTQFENTLMAITGAAPMGRDLQHAAMQRLGKGKTFISQTWGLSETTGSATYLSFGDSDDTGSVSPLIPNIDAR
jgi:long-subunit acyl-CoA synthetase (AMP-forming)